MATNWEQYYDDQYNAYLQALNTQYAAQKAQYEAQLPQIKQAYDAQRGQTYTNARVTALGQNERLASMGLAGNAYSSPMSGYSETSRVSQTNALRNALNASTLQQTNAEQGVQNSILQAGYTRDAAAANALADVQARKASALQNQSQFDAQMAMQQAAQQEAIRQYNEQMAYQQQLDAYNQQYQQEQNMYNQQQDAIARAYQELNAFGKIITQTSADALGVPIGTTYASMQVQQPATRRSSGGGGNDIIPDDTPITDEERKKAQYALFWDSLSSKILPR